MLRSHLDKTEIRGDSPVTAHIKFVVKITIGNTRLEFEPDEHIHSTTAGFTH